MTGKERGSAAVETVLVAPALLLLVALLIGGGRLLSVQGSLRAVAREAGRIAVTAPSAPEAVAWGQDRARGVALGYGLDQSRLQVSVQPGSFERGGDVRVEVSYAARLADLPSFGLMPESLRLTADHIEPIDLHRSR